MWRDKLRGIYYVALKDMRTYYFKPPAVSWGVIFPVVWILAFYLRNPRNFEDLIPGLIAMTILFSTTAAEAVVINFELKLGSLERLLLAPISIASVLIGKVLGGFIFGLLMAIIVTSVSILYLGLHPNILALTAIAIPSLLVFSSMGAFFSVAVKEVFEARTLLNLPRFIMVLSERINATWPKKTSIPCRNREESRFSPDFKVPLSIMGMEVVGDPSIPRDITCVQILNERKQRFEGSEKVVLADLLEFIKVHDPDVILFPMPTPGFRSLSRRRDGGAGTNVQPQRGGSSRWPPSPIGATARSTTKMAFS